MEPTNLEDFLQPVQRGNVPYSINHAPRLHGFRVKFRVQHVAQNGETICVVGSTPELGAWQKVSKVKLTLTEDNIWESEAITVSNKYFTYKYTVFQDGNFQSWERGFDRICDLSKQGRTIDYETNDTWETFKVCFNVHKQDSAQMHLQIYDHNVELVDQSIHDTIRMHRS